MDICKLWSIVLGRREPCLWGFQLWSAVLGFVWWEPCLWRFASFGRQFWASFGGNRVYWDLQALVGSSGPRLVGAVSMEICSFGRQFGGSYRDLQLWSAPRLVGSRVYGDLQALVGSDGLRLVGETVSMRICKLWSAVMGFVWWEKPCLCGFVRFGRQFWASFGGSRVYGDLQALVGSDGLRLVGAVSMGIWKLWSAVIGLFWWEPCLWGFGSFGRQFWASFGGSRVYRDLQALVGSSGPRVSM